METKLAYAPYANTDLTEGRGYNRPLVFCELRSTARRLGKGRDVMGSDATVREVTLVRYNNEWYGPVDIQRGSEADQAVDAKERAELERLAAKSAVLERARDLGLTEEELELLAS